MTTRRRVGALAVLGPLAVVFALLPNAEGRLQTITAPVGLELDGSFEPIFISQGINTGTPIPFAVIDSDGDGRDEMILGELVDSAWFRVSFDARYGDYNVDYVAPHPFPDRDLGEIPGLPWLVAEVGVPARTKIFAQLSESTMAVYDAETRELDLVSETSPRGYIGIPVAAEDVDGDGDAEIIFVGWGQVAVYNETLTRVLGNSAVPGSFLHCGFAVGNFDGDAAIEAVFDTGRVFEFAGYVLQPDGVIESLVNEELLSFLGAADVDGDGIDEIFAVYDTTIQLIDYDRGQVKWTADRDATAHRFEAARIVDLNTDGVADILIGEMGAPGDPGFIAAYDGRNGAELVHIQHPDISAHTINAGDFDGDGEMEIAVALVRPFTGPNRLYIYDATTGQQEWVSVHEDTPFRAVALGDADGDGEAEVVFAPRGLRAVGDIRLYAHDPITFAQRWKTTSQLLPELGTGAVASMVIGDADRDGDPHVVVGTSKDGLAQIWIIDGRTRQVVRGVSLNAGSTVTVLGFADLDNDGVREIAAATTPHDSSGSNRLYVVDGASGGILGSLNLPAPYGDLYALELGDVDGDGRPNIVIKANKSSGSQLLVADWPQGTVEVFGPLEGLGLALVNVAGDSALEIVLGRLEGDIEIFDGASGGSLSRTPVCDTSVNAIARNELPGAAPTEVFFSCDDRIGTINLATLDVRILAGAVGKEIGHGNRLLIAGPSSAQAHVTLSTFFGLRHLRPSGEPPAPVLVSSGFTRPFWYETHWRGDTTGRPSTISYNGLPLQLEIVEPPLLGEISFQGILPGGFRYLPRPARGIDHFIVRLNDGVRTSAPVALAVHVLNSAPAMPDGGFQRTGTIGQLLYSGARAIDLDDDPLRHELVTPPLNGTLRLYDTGDFEYTPNSGSVTQDSFVVRATDTVDYSGPATVTITLQAASPTPPSPPPPPPGGGSSGGGGGGGAFVWLEIVALFTGLLAIRRRASGRT